MAVGSTIHKTPKVDRARDRLSDAVSRLEKALSSHVQTVEQSSSATKDDSALISELMAATQKLQAENAGLREVNQRVSERLGDAIARFKQVIGD